MLHTTGARVVGWGLTKLVGPEMGKIGTTVIAGGAYILLHVSLKRLFGVNCDERCETILFTIAFASKAKPNLMEMSVQLQAFLVG